VLALLADSLKNAPPNLTSFTHVLAPEPRSAYDANDFNELTALLRWRGTIFPAVLGNWVMWILLGAHIGFLYTHTYHEDYKLPHLPWKLTAVPTALLTFFLVFYSGNCYTRYYAFYTKCTGMSGAVM
jgi:hypothetical protein